MSAEDDRTWYRADLRRVRLREAWRMGGASFLLALPAWLLFRLVGWPRGPDLVFADPAAPERVEPEALPPEAQRRLAPLREVLARAGFQRAFAITVPHLAPAAGFTEYWLEEGGTSAAAAVWVRNPARHETASLVLTSRSLAGEPLSTTSTPRHLDGPFPPELGEGRPGLAPDELIRRHRERVAALGSGAVAHLAGAEELAGWTAELARRTRDHFVARGLWVPLTPLELRVARERHAHDG